MEEIKKELINLGVRIRSVGFLYWIDTFQYVMVCPKTFHMMEVYDAISLKRGKSISSIERAMRYALEPAEKNIQDKFDYHKKIDNMTFINLMRMDKTQHKNNKRYEYYKDEELYDPLGWGEDAISFEETMHNGI